MLNDDLDLSALTDDARAGLRSPQVVILKKGQVLYRFASSSKAPPLWAAGPWWMHENDYNKVVDEYRKSRARHGDDGLTLGFLARGAMAVKHLYSKMDVVVKARVIQDIKAFAGLGRTQFNEYMPNGIHLIYQGWPNVGQLYLPNIGDGQGMSAIGAQALHVLDRKQVASQQLL